VNNLDGVITGACAEFFLCIVVHDFDFFSFSLEIAKESQFGQIQINIYSIYIFIYMKYSKYQSQVMTLTFLVFRQMNLS